LNEVSQSAATQSVHRLERHFGVQLVDRTKRPFVLTPEGQPVSTASARSWSFTTRLTPASARSAWRLPGWVRVASIYSVGLHDMSRCMQDFMRRIRRRRCGWSICARTKSTRPCSTARWTWAWCPIQPRPADLNVIPLRSERMVLSVLCSIPWPTRRRSPRTPPGRGFRRLRPRPDHPQGGRSLPAAARREHPRGHGSSTTSNPSSRQSNRAG